MFRTERGSGRTRLEGYLEAKISKDFKEIMSEVTETLYNQKIKACGRMLRVGRGPWAVAGGRNDPRCLTGGPE